MRSAKRKRAIYERTAVYNYTSRITCGSGNVFLDLGFPPDEAALKLAQCRIVSRIKSLITMHKVRIKDAALVASVCEDNLADILSGRHWNYTVDQLAEICRRISDAWPAEAPTDGPLSPEHMDFLNAYATSVRRILHVECASEKEFFARGRIIARLTDASAGIANDFVEEQTLRGMKKNLVKPHIADVPVDTIVRIAADATLNAARDARRAGRTVTGMNDGEIVEYGPLLDVVHVEAMSDFMLHLTFENGEKRVFDMQPYFDKGIFRRLQDMSAFAQAHIVAGTVGWPGDLDIAPETLYDKSKPIPK